MLKKNKKNKKIKLQKKMVHVVHYRSGAVEAVGRLVGLV
jgi:hypothetical protein